LITQASVLGERFKESQYTAEINNGDLFDCAKSHAALQKTEQFCDKPDGECKSSVQDCPDLSDVEAQLDMLVTNMWETGEIWGEIVANMFANTIDV
jgi:hypothetical protein